MQSTRTRVKICGLTRAQDVAAAARHGADAIGLVFHPPSPRAVSIERAIELARCLPPFVTVTALFLDDDDARIAEVVERVRPDCLQFHGRETPAGCSAWGMPYLKAIPMASVADPRAYAAEYTDARGFLLDSNAAGRLGGSGDTFDWTQIPASFDYPLILAGGINADNVVDAIARVRPWGVDVSSGVETARGIKSEAMIAEFMRAVTLADAGAAAHESPE